MSAWFEGNLNSRVLLIGEAPSYQEIREDRPFVGPAGEVLTDCLHSAELPRRSCYIINTFPYQVRKDKKTGDIYDTEGNLLWRPNKGFTDRGWNEVQPTLSKIREASPNVICPMGAVALNLCLGQDRKWPLLKYRGSPLAGQIWLHPYGKIHEVIPTIHPAATLHGTYLWRYLIISDLEKVLRHSETPGVQVPSREYILRPSLPEVFEYMAECRAAGRFCTDLEVINHEVSCFSLAYRTNEAMCVPLHEEAMVPIWDIPEEERIWLEYANLLEDPKITKVNQNLIGFDTVFLFQKMNILTKGFLADTMIAQSIMYPEFSKGLDFILSVHTDEPYYKDEGKMWKNLEGDIKTFWTYNGKDAACALEAWEVLAREMTEREFWPTYNMTARMANPLCFMASHGVRVDRDELEKTKEDISNKLANYEAELHSIAEWAFNPLSPAQCKKYFYETKGYQPYTNATGGVTTDDKAMARIVRRYNSQEARLVQEIRGLRKLKSTYLEVALDPDGRLRSSWNPRGTITGRLSSSETIFGTGMNMQNLHPAFNSFIVADEDM